MTIAINVPLVVLAPGGHTFILFAIGRKKLHAVAMGEPIKLVSMPIERARSFIPLVRKMQPYPVKRAARSYLRSEICKTGRATNVLRALSRGETAVRP